MIEPELEEKISKILLGRTYRSYFDWLSHEFNRDDFEFKLDRLAQLTSEGYLDIVLAEYLDRFEDTPSYRKLSEMRSALATTLKGYVGIIKNNDFHLHDLYGKTENDLDFIISAFKKDIIEIYIPKG